MSIMDIFRPSVPAARVEPTIAVAGGPGGNPIVPGGPGSVAAPTGVPAPAAFPVPATGDASPLAQFEKLWETDPNSPNKPGNLLPVLNLDATRLGQAAANIDFTKQLPAELVAKVQSGDPGAIMEALNKVAQFGFANALSGSGELVKQAFATAQTNLEGQLLPQAIRQANISSAMQENQAFADPAMKPVMAMLQTQLAQKYPTASPAEIASFAQQYMTGMAQKVVTGSGGQVLGKETVQQQSALQAPVQDWDKFFAS